MSFARAAALALGIAVMTAAPAMASSLPQADLDKPRLGVGVGTGLGWRPGGSLAVDVPLGDAIGAGLALQTTFTGATTIDARASYRFVDGSRESPAIAAIAGVWGVVGGAGPDARFTGPVPLAPSIGFGMAYEPLDKLTLRLNLAYSPLFAYGTEQLVFIGGPPTSGVEVAYEVLPGVEATLGLNGNGDVLGLNYTF